MFLNKLSEMNYNSYFGPSWQCLFVCTQKILIFPTQYIFEKLKLYKCLFFWPGRRGNLTNDFCLFIYFYYGGIKGGNQTNPQQRQHQLKLNSSLTAKGNIMQSTPICIELRGHKHAPHANECSQDLTLILLGRLLSNAVVA